MTHYESIYEAAADNYGLITSMEAREMGISYKEMSALASRGLIERRGHGVYRLTRWVPTAVLAMHGLALVNPRTLTVANPRRVRRKLPIWVKAVSGVEGAAMSYEGVPSQSIPDAIRTCKGKVMPERLSEAARDARREGLITQEEIDDLLKEIENG